MYQSHHLVDTQAEVTAYIAFLHAAFGVHAYAVDVGNGVGSEVGVLQVDIVKLELLKVDAVLCGLFVSYLLLRLAGREDVEVVIALGVEESVDEAAVELALVDDYLVAEQHFPDVERHNAFVY